MNEDRLRDSYDRMFCAIEALCGLEVAEAWLDTPEGKAHFREYWAARRSA